MIDIHCHILPGVDDGSRRIDESIEMAKIYIENGIEKVIATPHYIEDINPATFEENKIVLENLKKALKDEGLELEIYLGNEIYASPNTLEHIMEKRVATLNGTKYVLVEMPMFDVPMYMENIIYELCIKGYAPIIAHPERNSKIQEDPNILYEFLTRGALAQLNLPSIEGRYGEASKRTGELLLKHNMIHFVGTDAHSPRSRSPRVKKSLGILKDLVDDEIFKNITYVNGEALLENRAISIDEPIKYEEKKGFFSFIKSKFKIF